MIEQRHLDRLKTFLKAKIVFNNAMTSIDCIVRNFSPAGAQIAVDSMIPIPTEFELEIPLKGKVFLAQTRWRDANGLGVAFVERTEAAVPGDPQFDKLLQDNMRLKAILLGLTKQLQDLGQDVPSSYF